ncbi:regulatory protein RecX [Allofranklinella schreckenbergeri]|uniref:Regulatory protein RecX n=1 Tax=Allofranklinella schreckenbergeri TaxID=1076744 RepID=A0A3M6R8R2_9BURK|nr:regulatory protein RecX [Allofranklinella schreckenbergeri]RMX11707.1 regulatory protein RecX [Allofranklinella schreckenbergeri]
MPPPTQGQPPGARRPRPQPSLQARALQALARREYTISELRQKLSPHAPDAHAQAHLDALLANLQRKGLLSDERAAASLARQKASRYGNARIRQDLRAKGVDADTINATLAEQDDEWARAQAVWRARFGAHAPQAMDEEAAPTTPEQRRAAWQARQKQQAKQARFMLSRGFAPDLVCRLMDGEADA